MTKTISGKQIDPDTTLTQYSLDILNGLQKMEVYQDTVLPEVKAARRRRNKQARISRRANRA